ncbi:hypothetical protein ED92_38425 [Amycolatopsis sp. MJM2582]|uniref:hypothetical protein n=1 Tax=Amycolatopsis sp. MJM2582 TaxID=1427749 RepID=UPI00050806D7|nr:hypothetical protein [Amycolatopsis sp. MJM2582]KFZ76992.1 hypothetical protein ED92_38425 [Amycolatopsis sp. MJM2582]
MPEPVLISLAAALAGRTVVGLYELVKKKFSEDPEATAALEAAEGAAEDSAEVENLRDRLAVAEADDPDFAQRLRSEWEKIGNVHQAETGGVVNTVTGDVSGKVVQARDVQGGISF